MNISQDVKEAIEYKFTLRECLLGDRAFYRKVVMVVLPMIVQNTLTNIVSLLDNVMVGQTGTLQMSAVAIVNQLFFVYLLCVVGAIAGSGIYGTQFYGKGDMEGVRITLRFKFVVGLILTVICIGILLLFGRDLIGFYIAKDTSAKDAADTVNYALSYMRIMLIGLFPFSLTLGFAGTMRETGQTVLPMKASMTAMLINFIFNYLLIFGNFGFPKLGVQGAAIATVISRFCELSIIILGTCRKTDKYPFLKGLLSPFVIPKKLVWPILSKTLPLFLNETLWSLAQAVLLQCYSVRGISVIAAINISNTVSQIFNEVFLSIGFSTSIVVGQELGANRLVNARRSAYRMITLSLTSTLIMGTLLYLFAPVIPKIYNTGQDIRQLATSFIRVVSLVMPINALANILYFIIRSGGRTFITFLFDSCFSWCVSVLAAFLLTRFTALPILPIFITVCTLDILKCIIGSIMMQKGIWVRNIVNI
ncbi:MAG: MATE family efflux transporter [Lachnospiraceae bacterium]|nr:MATE family efflux transporter [Lachnospiraceae bacterium]